MSSDREVEAKFRLDDPADLRRALAAHGALATGQEVEENTILDTPDGQLRGRGAALRIRVARPVAGGPPTVRLTYKGPKDPQLLVGGIRAREELELEVGDDQRLAQVLDRLGYRPVLTYQKRRATWRLGECLVTIDELPGLGWFAEIEGPDADAIQHWRAALGIHAGAAVPETYVELAARHGRLQSDGTRRLTFDTRE